MKNLGRIYTFTLVVMKRDIIFTLALLICFCSHLKADYEGGAIDKRSFFYNGVPLYVYGESKRIPFFKKWARGPLMKLPSYSHLPKNKQPMNNKSIPRYGKK